MTVAEINAAARQELSVSYSATMTFLDVPFDSEKSVDFGKTSRSYGRWR